MYLTWTWKFENFPINNDEQHQHYETIRFHTVLYVQEVLSRSEK